jgi:intracellular septation protein A
MKNLFHAARPIISDMFSTIIFAALFSLTDNIYISTAAAVAMGIGQVLWEKLRGLSVPAMQWASLGLVTVLGGATLLTGDPRFVMVKPTIIYLTIGFAMLRKDWMGRYIPEQGKPYLPERLIILMGYVWAALMFFTAAANLGVAVFMGHKAWLTFIAVFPLASKIGLFAIHYATFRIIAGRNHAREERAALADGAALQSA